MNGWLYEQCWRITYNVERNTQIKINPLLLQIRKTMNHVLYVLFSAVNIYAKFIST
jgi:hypothetical protein